MDAFSGVDRHLDTQAVAIQADVRRSEEEKLLLASLEAVAQGDMDLALSYLRDLLRREPQFRLAQLIYADLLQARARPIAQFGDESALGPTTRDALVTEARARLEGLRSYRGRQPDLLLHLSASRPEALVVDLETSRLYVFAARSGVPELTESYFVSTGVHGAGKERSGDQRTPVGLYFTTGQVPGSQLPAFYGAGALPVNYPNEWDRRLGRTGYGIWIHGVPDNTYVRAPRSSSGCLTLANSELGGLLLRLPRNEMPVLIAPRVNWVSTAQATARRDELLARFHRWHHARSRDLGVEPFYSEDYEPPPRAEFGEVALAELWREEFAPPQNASSRRLSDVSVLAYPGERDLSVITFTRHAGENAQRRRQYWRKDPDGIWRIVHEEEATLRPIHLKGIPRYARRNILEEGAQERASRASAQPKLR